MSQEMAVKVKAKEGAAPSPRPTKEEKRSHVRESKYIPVAVNTFYLLAYFKLLSACQTFRYTDKVVKNRRSMDLVKYLPRQVGRDNIYPFPRRT